VSRRAAAFQDDADPRRDALSAPLTTSDAALVLRAANGDADAIAEIWSRHHRLVKSVLLSTLGADQDIDDLVQEVFLELIRAVKQMRDGSALPALLARIAVRRAGMVLRKRRVRSVILQLPWTDVPEVAVLPPDFDDRLALNALYRLMNRIKTRHRMAVLLHCVQGMEIAQVADALKISVSGAKRDLSAGRKRLERLAGREPRLLRFLTRTGEGTA
jgi:RNA polymerase sigma-70 factor (ECF subfamily)